MTEPELPSVVAIIGPGRSGSTLLDRLVAQAVGGFSAGELRPVWHRGFERDGTCGCGMAFSRCEVWGRVGRETFPDATDRVRGGDLRRHLERNRRLVPLLLPRRRGVELSATHMMWGNPTRFETGSTTVTVDDTWRHSLPAGNRRVATALTWPLLQRYGYLGRSESTEGTPR